MRGARISPAAMAGSGDAASMQYLQSHGMAEMVDGFLSGLLKDRPSNAARFAAEYFSQLAACNIFQLGTNNWQTVEEPAPGSGILHEAHHLAYNDMPGVSCYSVYPSSVHGTNPGRSRVTVAKLPHKIPICESVSPVSDKRWHSMSDAEIEEYLKRLEDLSYEQMATGEAEQGRPYDWVLAHHTFTNPLVMRRVIARRMKEGKPRTPMVVFCHGTALKMYVLEQKGEKDYPMRFKTMMDRERIFSCLETGARAVVVISEKNKENFLNIFPEFPADRVFVSLNGYNPLIFYPHKETLGSCLARYKTAPYAGSGRAPEALPTDARRMVLYVGKFADWKRLDAVLQAAKSYEQKQKYSDVVTVIVGTGQPDDIKFYQDMALKQLQLRRTYFIGAQMQPDLSRLYSAASIGIFPSKDEPFGMVFIECMACGTPVIGACSGGPKDFVSDEVGNLVPENNVVPSNASFSAGVEAAVCRSLDENWKASKQAACIKLTKAFSMNQQCRQIMDEVHRLLQLPVKK